jgi:hypothetical protein
MSTQFIIEGIAISESVAWPFTGTINIEERTNSFYYTWVIYNKDGEHLAGRSMSVSSKQIPDQDKLSFIKNHAIENIRKYRIERHFLVSELKIV